MGHRCSVHCIIPPFILKKLLESDSAQQREMATRVLMSSTALRADRRFVARLGSSFAMGAPGGGKQRAVFDCHNRPTTRGAVLVRKETETCNGDQAVNEAFDGVGKTFDFFSEVFHRNSIDNAGMRLDSYVHYDRNYPNAMWDGRRMIFGDGDGYLFSRLTKALDVIGHELTHGITQYTADLEYRGQSGALNESVSDVFGSLLKQWNLAQDAEHADWLIGAECWTPNVAGDALRSMKNPGSAYDDPSIGKDPQPGHMRDYVNLPETPSEDMGGVHINSGIPNHAFYLFAMKLGGKAWEGPGQIWYETLNRSRKDFNFDMFANMTYAIAGESFDPQVQQALKEAWAEVGINVTRKEQAGAPASGYRMEQSQEELSAALSRLSAQVGSLQRDFESFKQASHLH